MKTSIFIGPVHCKTEENPSCVLRNVPLTMLGFNIVIDHGVIIILINIPGINF